VKDRYRNNSGLSAEAKAFLEGLASIIAVAIQADGLVVEAVEERERPGKLG